jgi:hypothetical protein
MQRLSRLRDAIADVAFPIIAEGEGWCGEKMALE